MKSKAIICLVSLLAGLSSFDQTADAAPIQDLDRINNIVNQARGLADSARQGNQGAQMAPMMPQGFQQAIPTQQFQNPFSTVPPMTTTVSSPSVANTAVAAYDGTGVVVNDADIRINAGGHQFVVPRMGGGVYGTSVTSSGIPATGPPVPCYTGTPSTKTNIAGTVNAYRNFASAVQAFRESDFPTAATQMKQVTLPNGKVAFFDQFNSLVMFANADYDRSAEYAYTAAAHAQFWNWDQLRGYYGDPNLYSRQYQQLQTVASAPDAAPSAQFLLGYHHLMLGHREAAASTFENVLTRLPNDPVTESLLSISRQLPPQPVR